ncbi:MAG: hypothetical protein IID09_04385 [Candidatus Hydrogenedentes bacterium]|nr:hypothetical protein [Candidatus Hydrogenedentota bacterium]
MVIGRGETDVEGPLTKDLGYFREQLIALAGFIEQEPALMAAIGDLGLGALDQRLRPRPDA